MSAGDGPSCSSHCRTAGSGSAPVNSATSRPSLKARTAGMPWIPIAWAMPGLASTSTLARIQEPFASSANASRTGPRARQGAHHAAQKSTTTGTSRDRSRTSRVNVWSLTSMMFGESFVVCISPSHNTGAGPHLPLPVAAGAEPAAPGAGWVVCRRFRASERCPVGLPALLVLADLGVEHAVVGVVHVDVPEALSGEEDHGLLVGGPGQELQRSRPGLAREGLTVAHDGLPSGPVGMEGDDVPGAVVGRVLLVDQDPAAVGAPAGRPVVLAAPVVGRR